MKFLGIIAVFSFTISLGGQEPRRSVLATVNTVYDELNPVMSPDGKTLYFTIANHPQNTGGKKDPGDIWMSRLGDDNQWSAPVHGGSNLNNASYNAVAGFSAGGTDIFLLCHYDVGNNAARTQGIAIAHQTSNGWSRPENITIPYFQNKSATTSGYMLPDQSAFVYAAETYGSRGVEDLYVTIRNGDGKWSEPRNLGAVINTQFQELSPALSNDGRTLYFSSNGRKGKGSFDVYTATRLDDSWTNWSEPINVGNPVNSEGRDLFYRPYAQLKFSLYTSTINSDGYGDIKFNYDDPSLPKDTTTVVVIIPKDTVASKEEVTAKNAVIQIHGKVTSSKTGEAINAHIYFAAPATSKEVPSSQTEGYRLQVPAADLYTIRIEAPGYVSTLEQLDVHTLEMKDLEMNFKLQPVEIGTTVNLENVLFEQSKTALLPESFPELDLIANFLKANPNVKIELGGHTDNRGIPAQNVKLSQARVDRVKAYLVSKGIDKKRISGKGFGGSRPIASNDDEDTRQLNRRVEFTIKKF